MFEFGVRSLKLIVEMQRVVPLCGFEMLSCSERAIPWIGGG